MANAVAKFEKVSLEQYVKSRSTATEDVSAKEYLGIKLPVRSTSKAAGYDFFSPIDFVLAPGETITVQTGVKCMIDADWFLAIFPRSGMGFKYRLQLDNTVGIVDADYYNAESNEGHIAIKITNDFKCSEADKPSHTLVVKAGDRFAQGIFMAYGITVDDNVTAVRDGGMGSTGA